MAKESAQFQNLSKLAEFLSLSNPLEPCSDHIPGRLLWPEGINKDLALWLDGARPP